MRPVAALLFAGAVAACAPAPPDLGVLPEFSLTAVSSDGAPSALRREDLLGRIWVADFIFTRCSGPCPALSTIFAGLQRDLPESVGLLSVTVDPARDDPRALAAYARRYAAKSGRWLFVTGAKAAVQELLIGGFKVPTVEDPRAPSGLRVTHSTRLVLIDGQARLRGYFDADDPAVVDKLKQAITQLKSK